MRGRGSEETPRFTLLADRLDAVPKIAQWHYDEWARRDEGMTIPKVEERVAACIGRERAPLMVLAVRDDEVVGTAGLKKREISIYPQFEDWIGGVYVVTPRRAPS